MYLDMNRAFSGTPLTLTPSDSVAGTCSFVVATPPIRRIRRVLTELSFTPCPENQYTDVLIFMGGYADSPITTI